MSLDKTRSHLKRTSFISYQTYMPKEKSKTHNKTIGLIIVENFGDEEQLEEMLKHHVTKTIEINKKQERVI